MQKNKKITKKSLAKLIAEYGIHLWVIFFLVNVGIVYAVHFFLIAQTCLTTAQINADQRCLYVWGNQVFQKGSRSSPHQGHPCGTNVTTIIPASHIGNQASYLTPNFVANLCANPTPSVVPSVSPSVAVSSTPIPTATIIPTATGLVPSPACIGSCPITSPGISGVSLPSIQIPTGSALPGGTAPDSLIGEFFKFLQALLNWLLSILGAGGGSHSGHSGHHD